MSENPKPLVARRSPRATIHQSFWMQKDGLKQQYPQLEGDHEAEILVVGAGITGLSIGLELLTRGHRVTVCEANVIGTGTTGGSSGHLDAHPEMGPSQLIKRMGDEGAVDYTRMRSNAINTIERRRKRSEFTRVPAYYYTENRKSVDKLRAEFEAAQQIGLEVVWDDSVPIANAIAGYRIENMARIDSFAYLLEMAELFSQSGGKLFEQTLVSSPQDERSTCVEASGGNINFDHIVFAVHCNFTPAQRLYLQTPPYQSYVIAAKIETELPDALFWDDSDPYYYVRRATADGRTILAGGRDHRTGDGDEVQELAKLEAWINDRFEVQEIVSRWSAELFEPTDGLPFIGQVPGRENLWVATGLSGVGLTLGTAAGTVIADLVEGKTHPLKDQLSPSRIRVGSAAAVVTEQMPAAANLMEHILPTSEIEPESLQPGEGAVGTVHGTHTAACRDGDGCVHQLSPICPHMGGVLHWNPVEQTWDCPVHGGRFAADGSRLYGPPETGMSNS